MLLLALYKFFFFWDSESFIFFRSLSTHWQKNIFSNTAYTRNPPKMLFYSAAEQYSTVLMGGSLRCCCFAFIFFPPATRRATPLALAGRQLTPPSGSRGIFFQNVFAEIKRNVRDSFHPTITKRNIKSHLKNNSPLFHITSNIDKYTYTAEAAAAAYSTEH